MNKKLLLFGIVFLISFYSALAAIDMMSFEANIFDSNGDPVNGNISIEIYDAASAGNLIYNSSDDFVDNVSNGKIDIILGASTAAHELNLTFGTTYYMEVIINGNEIDFNGLERQEFQSQIGNVSTSRLHDIEDFYLKNTGDTASGNYNFDSNTLFVDSPNDFIGIRTATPANALNVVGDANFTGALYVGGTQITTGANLSGGGSGGFITKFITGTEIGNSIISETADKIAIGTGSLTPTHMLSVFGSGNFTGDLIVGGILTLGDLAANFINSTHLATDAVNTTHILDGTVALIDLAFSPLERSDNVAFKNESNTFSATQIFGSSFDSGGAEIRTTGELFVQKIYIDSGNTTLIEGQVVNGSQYPVVDITFNLGNSSNRWNEIYAQTFYGDGSQLSGLPNVSLNYVANESSPTEFIPALGTAEGVMKLDITSLSAEKSLDNFTGTDSIITDYIYPETAVSITQDNTTFLKDVHILGALYGGSPLVINADINLTGNITSNDGTILLSNDNTGNLTIENSLLTDYIYSRTNPVTSINNLTIANDIFSAFNITAADSVNSDFIFPKSASFIRIDNVTIAQDLRVLGNSYLSSFTIGNDLLVGSNNISSTFTGLGTLSPIFPLHVNYTDSGNNTITELLALERTNSSDAAAAGYGASILFKLADNTGEVENVSQIAGILEDVSNGTERGALVFYTGYGNQDGIISNLSSAEAARISANGTLTLQNDLRVLGNSYLSSFTIGNDLIVGSNNISSTDVGIGTTSPQGLLEISNSSALSVPWLNITDGSNGQKFIIDTGGNVGIGTTAPAWPSQSPVLHIKSGASALPAFVLESGHSTYPGNWTFRVAASGASDANLVITNGASNDRLTIDNSGNVGIGTTAPSNNLEISTGTNLGGLTLNSSITNGNPGLKIIGTHSDAATRSWGFAVSQSAFGDFQIRESDARLGDPLASGTARLAILSGGKVGINTTSPEGLLHIQVTDVQSVNSEADDLIVENNENIGMSFLSSAGLNNSIYFGDGNNNAIGQIVYDHGSDYLQFTTNTAERMRIDSNGNVLKSSNPAFSANSSTFTADVTGDGTAYFVPFDVEKYDKGNNFANSNFTAPVAGVYYFNANVRMSGATGGGMTDTQIAFMVGGTTYSRIRGDPDNIQGGNGVLDLSISELINLNAGDVVAVQVTASGGTKTLDLEGSDLTIFQGYLVG